MVDKVIIGRWDGVTGRLFRRGLISDFLNNPASVISEVLSPPAATTQEPAKSEPTQAPVTTQPAAAPTTPPPAAAPTTQQQAQQPAPTPTLSPPPKQSQPQTQPAAAQPPPTTSKPAAQQPTTVPAAANPVVNNTPPAAGGAVTSSAAGVVSSSAPANRASYSQSVLSQGSSVAGVSNAGTTKPGASPSSAQTSTATPNYESQMSGSSNSGPLVATGVVLGIVAFMGISLLLFWCYRRRRKANRHHHEALAPQSPVNDYASDAGSRFGDALDNNNPQMTESRAVSGQDQLTVQHALPNQEGSDGPEAQSESPQRSNPYSGLPFTYAQAQQYAQSHGAFSYPPVPPIPEPSPIRIFRWPTRSTRSDSSPSLFSGWRNSKATSRAMSRTSRSTVSSMLWHGRRDVARRTMEQQQQRPVSGRNNGFLSASNGSPDSTMPEGLHTPILDWLHWIRGSQSVGGDPEMNHRKSFASTAESSTSSSSSACEGSIASSGVFSPTLLSWPPPASDAPPVPDLEALAFLPVPPSFKRQSSNADTVVEPAGSRITSYS
ncbi:hypothetical protein CMUS01_12718 [Colletotrichum musicola]|uniref:Uncharacterized protein n=1 Tax=Colletotrichum musicola TaxID=2175873 RepID=A0A8H6MZK0_9PEZI|nr:hypothetical protein CMUS01_12718 [Colletotrichum musicola]